jgi:bisphosphoglycerate-independent phosphoglycerate mutase (AlkP superfamily)
MANIQKIILLILDGIGIGDYSISDVIYSTSIPFMAYLFKNYQHSQLITGKSM